MFNYLNLTIKFPNFWFINVEENDKTISFIDTTELLSLLDILTEILHISKLDLLESVMFFCLSLTSVIILLVNIAFYTLAERKVMAAIQRRKGPNLVGFLGLLQPISDGLKLLNKEIIIPMKANKFIFLAAPFLALTLSFVNWMLIAFSWSDVIISLNISLLVLFTISSFNIYSIIISGWASNSRYPFLGAIRAASQMISYEISITLVFLCVVLCTGSFNLLKILFVQETYGHYWLPLFPVFVVFIISILAETNRAPFDLPEAEAEIVAGYNLEYSSITFALFFLGEYSNMLLMSALTTILFFGGWHSLYQGFTIHNMLLLLPEEVFIGEAGFIFKTLGVAFFFILVRATFPRLRYDQLMLLGWTVFLPISTAFFIFLLGLKLSFSSFQPLTLNTIFCYSIV